MFNLPKNQSGQAPHSSGQAPHSSGQALLLVLLSMAVALTLVLSVLSRTISDVKISSQDENSQRAFSAAEAGIEQALVVGSDTGDVDIGDATFSATVSNFAKGNEFFVFPGTFVSGEPSVVWFVSHDSTTGNLSCSGADNPCFNGSQIKICWGDSTADPIPAIESSIVYLTSAGNYATAQIERAVFDANAAVRGNNFANPDAVCTIGSDTFQYSTTLNLSSLNNLQFMVLKLLYNGTSHHMGVDVTGSGSTLPSQGQLVESSGTSGDANRRVEVFQGYGVLPLAYYSAIYSGGGLTK
ncbi:MAG: pilus assembly PilX N-terminal domain-containing protein [bacterium]|nr:pilus assembly PilX N-terminal domain-containing protein [bacterium]